jgi:DNA-directed RNA polymerase specialized sigma24 family protein
MSSITLLWNAFSAVEIAHMLDLSEAAVRQRLLRARKRFRQIYALESGDADINGSARSQRRDDI